jgi:hypothetical protein
MSLAIANGKHARNSNIIDVIGDLKLFSKYQIYSPRSVTITHLLFAKYQRKQVSCTTDRASVGTGDPSQWPAGVGARIRLGEQGIGGTDRRLVAHSLRTRFAAYESLMRS